MAMDLFSGEMDLFSGERWISSQGRWISSQGRWIPVPGGRRPVSGIDVGWRWLEVVFLCRCVGDASCSSGPSYFTDDPPHGGPQRRVGLHHPAHSVAVWLIAQGILDLGWADGGRVQPDPGAELGDDLTHGPHVWALVPLAAPLQHLGGRVGLVAHVNGRVEAMSEELGESQVDDHRSVGVMFHLEDKCLVCEK